MFILGLDDQGLLSLILSQNDTVLNFRDKKLKQFVFPERIIAFILENVNSLDLFLRNNRDRPLFICPFSHKNSQFRYFFWVVSSRFKGRFPWFFFIERKIEMKVVIKINVTCVILILLGKLFVHFTPTAPSSEYFNPVSPPPYSVLQVKYLYILQKTVCRHIK